MRNSTHGLTRTGKPLPTWRSWSGMMRRCYDEKDNSFARYGGRGIKVALEWHDHVQFLADMGERPPNKSLDRIDSTKGYSKDNCRWATATEQSRNRSCVRLTVADVAIIKARLLAGEKHTVLAAQFGVTTHVIGAIKAGKSWREVEPAEHGEKPRRLA